jgi:acetyltransferase-like isoleucine patch superfamily enzyme
VNTQNQFIGERSSGRTEQGLSVARPEPLPAVAVARADQGSPVVVRPEQAPPVLVRPEQASPFVARPAQGTPVVARPEQASPFVATTPKRSLRHRLRHAVAREFGNLKFRLLLADFLILLLPDLSFTHLRTALYRLGGIKIGRGSYILGRLTFAGFSRGHQLRIGENTLINANCVVDLNADIHIGDRVSIGHHVTFITADHEMGPAACRAGHMKAAPISIGSGSWICARTVILPGVSIGESSVVAAASLVSGNVPANKVVGGVPARPLKSLPAEP